MPTTPTVKNADYEANQYRAIGMRELEKLKREMQLGGLTSGRREVTLNDGTVITCVKCFCQEEIVVNVAGKSDPVLVARLKCPLFVRQKQVFDKITQTKKPNGELLYAGKLYAEKFKPVICEVANIPAWRPFPYGNGTISFDIKRFYVEWNDLRGIGSATMQGAALKSIPAAKLKDELLKTDVQEPISLITKKVWEKGYYDALKKWVPDNNATTGRWVKKSEANPEYENNVFVWKVKPGNEKNVVNVLSSVTAKNLADKDYKLTESVYITASERSSIFTDHLYGDPGGGNYPKLWLDWNSPQRVLPARMLAPVRNEKNELLFCVYSINLKPDYLLNAPPPPPPTDPPPFDDWTKPGIETGYEALVRVIDTGVGWDTNREWHEACVSHKHYGTWGALELIPDGAAYIKYNRFSDSGFTALLAGDVGNPIRPPEFVVLTKEYSALTAEAAKYPGAYRQYEKIVFDAGATAKMVFFNYSVDTLNVNHVHPTPGTTEIAWRLHNRWELVKVTGSWRREMWVVGVTTTK